MTFNHGMGGEHMTAIAGSGNPGPEKLLHIASAFHLPDGKQIIGEVRQAVSHWAALAARNGVSEASSAEIGAGLAAVDARF